MNTTILTADNDPMGAAILDYQKTGKADKLRVLSTASFKTECNHCICM